MATLASDHLTLEIKQTQKSRKYGIWADSFNFLDSLPGTMSGVALIMVVDRDELKTFWNELKQECL